ncbi:MAG: hypothetical protein JWM11_6466 [Planctomycetaceae bacterium]|nr:hypothetical protein [Planctomycetaceae bacterium]
MIEDKRKHLEFIQNVITRMSTNSFMLRGWMVTLVSALFALAAKDAQPRYVMVTWIAIPAFWLLDAFYLSQERQFRGLYDAVRLKDATDYSMDTSPYNSGCNSWSATFFSWTLIGFYVSMGLIVFLVKFLLQPHA